MDKTGFKVKKVSSGGGIFRRMTIFVLVAGAIGTGIWYLFPHDEKKVEDPAAALPAARPPAPAVLPVPEIPPAEEDAVLQVSQASQAAPAPAEDPVLTVEKKPAPAPVPPEPVRKGIAHVTDPADEGPYLAPDMVPAPEFAARMKAIREGKAPGREPLKDLQKLLQETGFASPQYREAAKCLTELNRTRETVKGGRSLYIVKPGDSLIRLARKFHLPTSRLAAENGLESTAMLKIGQKLQVPEQTGSWSVRISKSARLLRVYREKELFAVYDVGIGRRDLTPEGWFILREVVDDPPYPLPAGGMAPPGSPENQLGVCWLGLGDRQLRATGYGIHGTPDEDSVTRNLSAGCVRMRNKEVVELRSRIPVGTPVIIEN